MRLNQALPETMKWVCDTSDTLPPWTAAQLNPSGRQSRVLPSDQDKRDVIVYLYSYTIVYPFNVKTYICWKNRVIGMPADDPIPWPQLHKSCRVVVLLYGCWIVEIKSMWKFKLLSKYLRSTRTYSTFHLFDLSWKLLFRFSIRILHFAFWIYITILHFNSSTSYCIDSVKNINLIFIKTRLIICLFTLVWCRARFILGIIRYICIFYIFYTERWYNIVEIIVEERTRKLIMHSQHHGIWCFVHSRSQGIRRLGTGQVCPEYSGFSTRRTSFFWKSWNRNNFFMHHIIWQAYPQQCRRSILNLEYPTLPLTNFII